MSNDIEEHECSPRLDLFFKKLTELKEFIDKKAEENKDPTLSEIYDKLDQIFKVKK